MNGPGVDFLLVVVRGHIQTAAGNSSGSSGSSWALPVAILPVVVVIAVVRHCHGRLNRPQRLLQIALRLDGLLLDPTRLLDVLNLT